MKRFKFTILAVCLLLIYLGTTDLLLLARNQAPLAISVTELEQHGAPREWLHISDGYLDLDQAISTSGTVELEALLVPLKASSAQDQFQILIETHNPRLLELFQTYYFHFDSVFEKERFRKEHADEFISQRNILGMTISSLIADSNRHKLLKLAKDLDKDVSEDTIFISEGKEPARYRGFLFFAVGILGILKTLLSWKKQPKA